MQEKKIRIISESDIPSVLLAVYSLAQKAELSPVEQRAIVTAASELSWNVVKFAKKGEATIRIVEDGFRRGIELIMEDNGPGILDIDKAMDDNISSVGTLGLGLPGTKRMTDEFDLVSEVGKGTKVRCVKWGKNAI